MNMFETMRRDAGMTVAELAKTLGTTERHIKHEESKPSYDVGVYYAINTAIACGHDPRNVLRSLENEFRSLQAAGLL